MTINSIGLFFNIKFGLNLFFNFIETSLSRGEFGRTVSLLPDTSVTDTALSLPDISTIDVLSDESFSSELERTCCGISILSIELDAADEIESSLLILFKIFLSFEELCALEIDDSESSSSFFPPIVSLFLSSLSSPSSSSSSSSSSSPSSSS